MTDNQQRAPRQSGARWPDCATGWHDRCTSPTRCGCPCHTRTTAASNQQRAADLWDEALCNSEVPGWSWRRMLAAALDAAEARGRGEVAAKVEALATEWLRDGTAPVQAIHLRWLIAEVTA